MRLIGRLRREGSPVIVDVNRWPASIPAIRRIVVPLLPQSSGWAGAVKPCFPFPTTATLLPFRSINTPSLRKHSIVAAQSTLDAKLLIRESPSAIDASIIARCEIDLSPGRLIAPSMCFDGDIFIATDILI
jgi:hypothetical protein